VQQLIFSLNNIWHLKKIAEQCNGITQQYISINIIKVGWKNFLLKVGEQK
jgi:hypothetical protein